MALRHCASVKWKKAMALREITKAPKEKTEWRLDIVQVSE